MENEYWEPLAANFAIQHNEMNTDELRTSNTTNFERIFANVINQTFCENLYLNETFLISEQRDHFLGGFCGPIADPVTCWPPTPANTTAFIRCFSELNLIKYDDTQNATRFCMWNGTWAKSNYTACREIISVTADVESTIYFVGYTFGLITLSLAVGIFTYFKELRCLRNTIHMNLMWSYMLTYTMWIITLISLNTSSNISVPCIFIITLLHYFHITTFFWMFVEGLYLYILVVETLTRENFKLNVYLIIGWVVPMVFIGIWAALKSFIPNETADPANTCDWFDPHLVDWIFQTPQVAVLMLNLIFLVAIMWVLVTKLRSANTVETQQYHKAAKALLVLMPLLGVTYIITIWAPTPDANSKNIFERARAVLLSLQGFTVALLYCFLNTEVQNAVRHRLATWKTRRSLGPNRLRSGSRSKDWSPRSRTESIRLYSQPTNIYHKRESSASEVTTTTLITVNGGTTGRPSMNDTPSVASQRTSLLHPSRIAAGFGGNV